ncbi:MAG: hypothetical protein JSW62_01175 [Thermoplasmatales archaeon]|nr:MAG: hypothetical protein JSW62_01175 [Thermoplasmatales archaeon]
MNEKYILKSDMRMPQLDNKDVIARILKSTIGVIGRRTSESYATVIINDIVKKLSEKYDFLKYVEVKNVEFSEESEAVHINSDINYVKKEEIGNAVAEFIGKVTKAMGNNAGYYFIKEIKEDLPHDYEYIVRDVGVDLDSMQIQHMGDRGILHELDTTKSEIIKHVIKTLFDILEKENNRNYAVSFMKNLISKFSAEYDILKYIEISDLSFIQGVDTISVKPDVDAIESDEIGRSIQKIINEINKSLGEKGGFYFVERLKERLGLDRIVKLEEMGVNLNKIPLGQDLVIKNVLKALVDVLTEASTQSYAILVMNNILRKTGETYDYLKYIKIDGTRYSEGIDSISVPSDIYSIGPGELGRGIQKIMENLAMSLGKEASPHFIDIFKRYLGKTYLLKIEEMGVNLHIVRLRQDLFR